MALRTEECIKEMNAKLVAALGRAGLIVEAGAKEVCPVRTGNLRASITTEVNEEERYAMVGTNVEYAPYVELGVGQDPQPFLSRSLEENKEKILKEFEGIK